MQQQREADVTENPETFPRLLAENVRTRGDQPAYREKDLGIWNTWSWREAAAEIRAIAQALDSARITRAGAVLEAA